MEGRSNAIGKLGELAEGMAEAGKASVLDAIRRHTYTRHVLGADFFIARLERKAGRFFSPYSEAERKDKNINVRANF